MAQASANTSARATQDFVPIEEIRDGVVVLKNGSIRLLLLVSSLNFALKSEDEQTALLLQFQNFLNSLDFHIQIFVQSRRLDIRPYIRLLEERLTAQTNELLRIQTREYIEFIRRFTETTDIMSKNFFVVIPYSPPVLSSGQKGLLGRFKPGGKTQKNTEHDNFDSQRTQLEQRAAVVAQGLSRLGLRVAQLGTEELVELYFKIFNPGESEAPQQTN